MTGGSGFIGSTLCREWLTDETVVLLNLDLLTYAAAPESMREVEDHPRYRFVHGSIADRAQVDRVLRDFQPEAIVHLAAESHVDRSIDDPVRFVATNTLGTCTLLTASLDYWCALEEPAKAAFRFLNISTDEVFGELGPEGRFVESTPFAPRSPYSASKAAGDHLAAAWFHTFGFPVLTTHCSNNYGPRQFPEKLIPLMLLNALEGRTLPIYGDGANVRDWIHVVDHVKALKCVLAGGRPGESFNIGGSAERSNLEVVEHICEVVDSLVGVAAEGPRRRLITFVQDRPGHDRRYAIDDTKIREDLQWRPEKTFEAGLEQTVRWYLANESWWAMLRTSAYGGQRLGLSRASAAG